MNEVNCQRRGHDFLPGWDELTAIPPLYSTENVPVTDKIIHLHFFVGSCDWYIAELDVEDLRAFGYVNLGDPNMAEWGYVPLDKLEAVRVGPGFVVERDLDWTPRPLPTIGQ